MSRLLAAGALLPARAHGAALPAAAGGGGGGGGWPSPQPAHTGISTWVKLDTTNLWQANGGTVAGGSLLTINGGSLDAAYAQPTATSPIVTYLMPVGTVTFALGSYSWTMDVYWRGYPWKALSDSYTSLNATYYAGSPPQVQTVVPGASNGWADGTAFHDTACLNNSYSQTPDAGPATSCVFVVLPGDEPFQPGTTTKDTRSEISLADNYSSGASPIPGAPAGGIDAMANTGLTVRFWRHDFAFPSSYTAPVLLQNSNGAVASPSTSWCEPAPTGATWAGGTGRGMWGGAMLSATVAPADQGGPAATTTLTNVAATIPQLSNILENQGPAVLVWGGGTSGGTLGGVQFRYQPTSMGVSLKQATFDTINVAWDARYQTIVEYRPGLFATSNGQPWIATSATDSTAWQTLPATVTAQPGSATVTGATITGSGLSSAMIGRQYALAGNTGFFKVLTFTAGTSSAAPSVTVDRTVPVAVTAGNMAQAPWAPYGVPPGTRDGGYLRIWRVVNGVWTCVSANTANAVPGSPTISNGTIIGDPTTGLDAGKVFGPTLKCQGATLATGPDHATGTELLSTTVPPFNVTVASVVSGTAFRPQGGQVLIDNEMFTFSSWTGSTSTLHITARAMYGTTAASHLAGARVAGLIDINEASYGVNQSQTLSAPMCVREWPPMIGPTFSSVSTPAGP